MADKRWGLRIKNEATCRQITELAALWGVTKTEAVNRSLRAALERERSTHMGELPVQHHEVDAKDTETPET